MSGRRDRGELRAQLPLLDRLMDDAPDQERDRVLSNAEVLERLRASVRRDLQSLLNARRRWRSLPPQLGELETSPAGYGLPDFAAGAFNDADQREVLRLEVERTIRRFEPRFISLKVRLSQAEDQLSGTLRLRVEALLDADPAPEPVGFDTLLDAARDDVVVRETAA
ncbi:type VI secretion system baseplate subunit TssE [Falsiroseomonas oryziterrae]|uniref:type VI secretion system baseplate subunit TssE n=1 Tax=Falsiroseomonas oryziterrae TaxID=2911368 RepID=UPI001EFFFDB7|nr:type VI secretion system baseplate subunit TssE [Roseomonas sp. NPKOSM-4]